MTQEQIEAEINRLEGVGEFEDWVRDIIRDLVTHVAELEKWKEAAKQLAWNAPSVAKLVGLSWDDKDKTWVIEKEQPKP
jgi:hypothetical protein